MHTRLFVIESQTSNGPTWWTCSREHGCGWHDKYPKQAFSKSELAAELAKMIEREQLPNNVAIRQLQLPAHVVSGVCGAEAEQIWEGEP